MSQHDEARLTGRKPEARDARSARRGTDGLFPLKRGPLPEREDFAMTLWRHRTRMLKPKSRRLKLEFLETRLCLSTYTTVDLIPLPAEGDNPAYDGSEATGLNDNGLVVGRSYIQGLSGESWEARLSYGRWIRWEVYQLRDCPESTVRSPSTPRKSTTRE